MASEKWSIKLEVGDKDQVGFSRAGADDYCLGYSCPRGRWTHLAFVAAAKKKKVSLYADGHLVGLVEEKCKLPMHFIGGPLHSMKGWLCEVRLWNIERTRQQILSNVDKMLDLKSEGLVGYFTFEEGKGNYAADWTEVGNNQLQIVHMLRSCAYSHSSFLFHSSRTSLAVRSSDGSRTQRLIQTGGRWTIHPPSRRRRRSWRGSQQRRRQRRWQRQ